VDKTRRWIEVSAEHHLYSQPIYSRGKNTQYQLIGGWVGCRAGLNALISSKSVAVWSRCSLVEPHRSTVTCQYQGYVVVCSWGTQARIS